MKKKTFREVFNIAISGIPENGGFLPFPLNMERNLGANCPGGNKPNSHFHFSLWFTLNNFSSEMQNKQSFYLNCSQILKYFNWKITATTSKNGNTSLLYQTCF